VTFDLVGQVAVVHSVVRVCRALGVSRSGYYAHLRKAHGERRRRDEALKGLIGRAFADSRRTYGSVRMVHALAGAGEHVGKNRVRRLMGEMQLRVVQKRRFRPRTTDSNHALAVAPNWPAQIPAPAAPNQVWTSDITYIATGEGWLFLSAHMDLCSRRIVGWSTSERIDTALVEASLKMALAGRRPGPGLIHHSDRGSQYASRQYRQLLADNGVSASMSRRGNCYDNAAHESLWATLKTECFAGAVAATRRQAHLMIFSYIEGFYNSRRLHGALGYVSPQCFEQNHHARSLAAARAAASCGATAAGAAPDQALAASQLQHNPAGLLAFGSVGRIPPAESNARSLRTDSRGPAGGSNTNANQVSPNS
jgi:putative transposase